ncbi:putative GT4: distantly related to 1L-myo-inositol-1-P a-N-acetylglucoaminyltransferase [uncultured Gammaproteobacteria bacterium]
MLVLGWAGSGVLVLGWIRRRMVDTNFRSIREVGAPARLRVAVLVDLARGPGAGGHVRCWEKIALATAEAGDGIDLTVHFSGERTEVMELGPWVRFKTHRRVFGTERLPFLSHVPDHTDLAPFHPGLARDLAVADVIHTTDAFFAFARTAGWVARRLGKPLVNSIHTDTPRYAGLFTGQTVTRLFGQSWLARVLLGPAVRIDRRVEQGMLARLSAMQRRCAFALVSHDDDHRRALAVLPPGRVGWLRRGIDREAFSPSLRDRNWLMHEFGIPAGRTVILCVGRVNVGKNVMTLAQAVRGLVDRGAPVVLLCAGEGDQCKAVLNLLGDAARCPGVIDAERLARVYASADLFAMPSKIEVFANVVLEALASGLPALVAERGGMGRLIRPGETGLVVAGEGPQPWFEALAPLVGDGGRRAAMAAAALLAAERDLPSWVDVVRHDLAPVWRTVAEQGARGRSLKGAVTNSVRASGSLGPVAKR